MSAGEATMDSDAWDQRYAGRELVWTSEANRFLVEESGALTPGRAIDLACGEGRNAVWLAERRWRVTGVDFSKVGLEKAQRLADAQGVQVDWIAANLLDFRPHPQVFDLVLIFYLHVPQTQRTPIVRAAADAVTPGGTLLLVGHDSSNIEQGHGGPHDPTVLYTAEDIARDLQGSALRIERAEAVERPVETPNGQRIALDALVRAARD